MKYPDIKYIKFGSIIIFICIYSSIVFASSHTSPNYTISNPKIIVAGGTANSTNYFLYDIEIGNIFGGKAESANYTLDADPEKRTPPNPPALNPVTSPTNIPAQTLSGTKDMCTSIYINGYQAVPLNNDITWSYDITLTEGENHLLITARNRYDIESEAAYENIILDITAPDEVTVTDDGDYTIDNTQLTASWTQSQDAGSGLKEYKYTVGTTAGGNDIADWASNGLNVDVVITGLSLIHGPAYYISVRAYDNADNYSEASSDGIQYDNPPEIVSFSISHEPPPSFHQNTTITLDTNATDADSDDIQYKYTFENHEGDGTIRDYDSQSTTTWNPYGDYVKETTLKVFIKACGVETGPEEKQAYIFRAPVEPQ